MPDAYIPYTEGAVNNVWQYLIAPFLGYDEVARLIDETPEPEQGWVFSDKIANDHLIKTNPVLALKRARAYLPEDEYTCFEEEMMVFSLEHNKAIQKKLEITFSRARVAETALIIANEKISAKGQQLVDDSPSIFAGPSHRAYLGFRTSSEAELADPRTVSSQNNNNPNKNRRLE